jgi:hypothetical protein
MYIKSGPDKNTYMYIKSGPDYCTPILVTLAFVRVNFIASVPINVHQFWSPWSQAVRMRSPDGNKFLSLSLFARSGLMHSKKLSTFYKNLTKMK